MQTEDIVETEVIVEEVNVEEFLRECRQKRFEQALKLIEFELRIKQRIAETEARIRQKENPDNFDMAQFYQTYYGSKKRDI